MTVSNPPSMSSIISEFGSGGSPKNLYAYRRGGGIVGAGFTGVGDGSSGDPVKLSQFAGISAIILMDTQTLVTKSYSNSSGSYPNYTNDDRQGYTSAGYLSGSSCSDGSSDIYSGAFIYEIYTGVTTTFNASTFSFNVVSSGLYLTINGSLPNSGWTYVEFTHPSNGVTTYYRSNASYFQSGGKTYWSWGFYSPSGVSGAPTATHASPTVVKWYL